MPSLGVYNVRFFNESEEVYDFLGGSEFSRLDSINHLGVASYVFTGANHSRLEYMLLQCAIIELLPKFHKGREPLSLSGKVSIPGQKSKISSGEELLKCWSLLSNSGHTQYTFGVERSLLNKANADLDFRLILVQDFPPKLKKESLRIIEDYDDSSFHLILSLFKIARLPKGSRLKARLFRLMAVLMLPVDALMTTKPNERYKLYRLKKLYQRVRLLSIVSLDSYYSHLPIRYDVSSALLSLDSLFSDPGVDSNFIRLLKDTSAWLADSLYMHPKAASAQKYYEVRSKTKIESSYAKRFSNEFEFEKFFLNIMANGFGKPNINKLVPLARMTFPYTKSGSWFGRSLFELNSILENQISPTNSDYVSVLLNPYSNNLHIDLLYDPFSSSFESIGLLCSRTSKWLLRLIEAQVKHIIRRFPESIIHRDGFEERLRSRETPRLVRQASQSMMSLFEGVVQFLLPTGYTGNFTEVMSKRHEGPIGLRLNLVNGEVYDTIKYEIDGILSKNNRGLHADRLHELESIKKYISRSKAQVIIVSLEKYIIKNSQGEDVDDWDGVVLEVFEDGATFSIIEAKKLKNKASRATHSFKQLKATQSLIKRSHKSVRSRRQRLVGYGAILKFSLREA